jgi:hypothetical protein
MTPPTKEDKPKFVKAFEKDQEKTDKILKSFNIDDFTGATDEEKTEAIDGLGVVKFKLLSLAEIKAIVKRMEVENVKAVEDQGTYLIAEMMHKADGTTTFEKLQNLPSAVASRLLEALGKHSGFL